MSLESHLSELQKKHEALDALIADEQRQPGSDDLEIRALKKRKLKLKEEIERWKHSAA